MARYSYGNNRRGNDRYGGWAPYVPVAVRRKNAEAQMAKLRAKGHDVQPVVITGRAIATSFWGKAWCDNLVAYSDYANRLPRGMRYVRNGSVVDLHVHLGKIVARVQGSSLYNVEISVAPVAKEVWSALCDECGGAIDSLVELLQGRFSKGVMERICRLDGGLFPSPRDIRLRCSCPDSASMCKHVAAVLYGVGARLDHAPELLFLLRQTDPAELVARAASGATFDSGAASSDRALDDSAIGDIFGIELAGQPSPPPPVAASASRPRRAPPATPPPVSAPAPKARGRTAASMTPAEAPAPKARGKTAASMAPAEAPAPKARGRTAASMTPAEAPASKARGRTAASAAAPVPATKSGGRSKSAARPSKKPERSEAEEAFTSWGRTSPEPEPPPKRAVRKPR